MPAQTTKTDALLRLARKGPVRARDLEEAGIPRAYLRRLCDRGMLKQVDRGIYRLADAKVSEFHTLAEVAVRVPHATVCLLSALQFHELTTEVPHAVWLMIDRHARMPKLSYPKLEVVRASGPALEHVGLDVAMAALRDYLRAHRGGMSTLVEAARADRVYTFMRPYLEALA
jgi:predicted transcriptional regulator of viral defense system